MMAKAHPNFVEHQLCVLNTLILSIYMYLKSTCYVNLLSKLSIFLRNGDGELLFSLYFRYTDFFLLQYNTIFFIPIKVPQGAMTNIHS